MTDLQTLNFNAGDMFGTDIRFKKLEISDINPKDETSMQFVMTCLFSDKVVKSACRLMYLLHL